MQGEMMHFSHLKRLVFITFCISFKIYTQDPLKILFVVRLFPRLSQTFILDQMTGLIDRGHKVTIYSLKDVDVEKLDHIQSDISKYNLLEKTYYSNNIPNLNDFDIIFIQFGNLTEAILHEARKQQYQGKIVVCFRGHDLTGYVKENPYFYRNIFPQIDLCLPVCDYFKQKLLHLHCPPEKIAVVYSPINTQLFEFKEERSSHKKTVHFISVARLVRRKGLHIVIEALKKLKRYYPSFTYIIVGDGIERKRLEKQVIHNKLQKYVKFIGWTVREKIIDLLHQSDLFILPSITSTEGDEEGIPNVLKEAMAVGVTVLATNHAGNSELIDNKNSGFLVNENSISQVEKMLKYFIDNRQECQKLAYNARQKVETYFDIQVIISQLEEHFYKLIHNSKQGEIE